MKLLFVAASALLFAPPAVAAAAVERQTRSWKKIPESNPPVSMGVGMCICM